MSDSITIDIGLNGTGQVTSGFNEIQNAANRTKSTLNEFGSLGGIDSFLGRLKSGQSELDNLRGAMDRVQGAGGMMLAGGMAGLAGLGTGIKATLDSFGQLQTTEAGFETMLGSPQAAKDMIRDVQEFAARSPYDFMGSAKAVQGLLAVGVAGDDIIPIMEGVGNAVAASGGDSETFQGILTTLQQTVSEGKLTKENLNQITGRGIGVQFLAQKLGLTAEQLANVGEEGIDADRAIKALTEGFSEVGGGTAMAKQMETIPGQVSSLGDSFEQLKAQVGEVFSEDASGLIKSLTGALDAAKAFTKENPELVKTAALLGGGLLAGTAVVGGGLMIGGGIARGAMDISNLWRALRSGKGAASALDDVTDAAKKSTSAKDLLTGATLKDAAAEKLKTGIAGAEGDALAQVAEDALDSAGAKKQLTTQTEKAAEKMGLLGRAKALLGKEALQIAPGTVLEKMGVSSGARSVGQLGGAAALGAASGFLVHDALSNEKNQAAIRATTGLDVGEGTATALGGGAALAVGALTLLAPEVMLPAAAALAIGTAISQGLNHFVNDPAEKAAEVGSGAENEDVFGKDMADKQDVAQKAANTGTKEGYTKMAEHFAEMSSKAGLAGDTASQESYNAQAGSYRALARKAGTAGTAEYDIAQYAASVNATSEGNKEEKIKAYAQSRRAMPNYIRDGYQKGDSELEAEMAENERLNGGKSSAYDRAQMARVQQQTQGDVSVEVKVTRGDTKYERDSAQYGQTRRAA